MPAFAGASLQPEAAASASVLRRAPARTEPRRPLPHGAQRSTAGSGHRGGPLSRMAAADNLLSDAEVRRAPWQGSVLPL